MACDCFGKIDAALAERNTELIFARPGYVTPTIQTEIKVKKRGARPIAVLPTYCPFCGTRYEPEKEQFEEQPDVV